MNEREILLKKIGTYQFAILDLNIFLNTHPGDGETLMKVREYRKLLTPLIAEYESKFGPLTKRANTGNTWKWVKDPWPWDMEDN